MFVGYTADPNWSNVACACVRIWGKKTGPKARPLGDKTRPIGTLLMYILYTLLSSPLLSFPLLCCRFPTLPYSSLLHSSLPTPTLFDSSLPCSSLTLIYPSLLYSIEFPQHRSFSPNKRRLNNGVRYCENGTRFLVKTIVPMWFGS